MATTNIELDIENVTGVSDADDQFVKSAQKFVVSSIPKNLLHWAGTSTASATHGGDDSPTAVTLPQPTDNILDVQRNNFDFRLLTFGKCSHKRGKSLIIGPKDPQRNYNDKKYEERKKKLPN